MNCRVFKADQKQLTESYVVSIFDGTGSMYHEYKPAIEAYFEVFSDKRKGLKEFQFQFQHEVYDLLPFQGTSGGNITKTFQTVFKNLLQNKERLPKCLTIVFMSDGDEPFNISELRPLILEMKKIFSTSFISLAVGKNFPYKISNHLRNEIHNQDPKIQSLFLVQRNRKRSQAQVKQLFKDVFQKIKDLIYIQEGQLFVNQDVQQTLVSPLSNIVIPGSVFFIKDYQKQVEINGHQVLPSQKEEDIIQLIQSSVQEGLIKATPQTVQKIFQTIQIESSNIVNGVVLVKNGDAAKIEKIKEIFEFVDNVAEGNLPLNQLTDDQKTKIQEALISEQKSLKEEVIKYVQKVKNAKDLTEQNFKERISEKYRQIKYGCFGEGEQKIQELSKLEQTEIVMKETLRNLLQVLENNLQCDVLQLLDEFKNQTFISLNKVFKECDFKVETQEQINILKEMNHLFELIFKVTMKLTHLSEFIQTVKSRLENQQTEEANNVNQSNAMFDNNEDFNYLPQELKLLVKEGIELEDTKNFFILIVDYNQSMEQECNIATEKFLQVFKNASEEQKFIIGWKEQQFFLCQNLMQQEKYKTLFLCLEAFEEKYDLKNKRIQICLVSDGLTDYRSIHKEFKVVKFHYSIQFIYLTIGRNLYALIEAELKQKFSNKNVKGCPRLLNIPRQLLASVNSINSGQKIREQFHQKFEQLLKEFSNNQNYHQHY